MFVGVFLIHCFSMFYLFYVAKMIHKSPNRCETRAATLTVQGCLPIPAASLCSADSTLKLFLAIWQHCFDKHRQRRCAAMTTHLNRFLLYGSTVLINTSMCSPGNTTQSQLSGNICLARKFHLTNNNKIV